MVFMNEHGGNGYSSSPKHAEYESNIVFADDPG